MMIIVRFIKKNHRNFFRYTTFELTYVICKTSVFTFVMARVFKFAIIFVIRVFIFDFFFFFLQRWPFVWLRYDLYSLFVNGIIFLFSKLLIFTECSLKDSQKFLMQSSPLCKPSIFSIPLDVYIVDIAYPQGICSPTFDVDNFSRYFLYSCTF